MQHTYLHYYYTALMNHFLFSASSSCRFPLSASFSVPLRFPWFRCRDVNYFDVLKRR